MGTAKIIHMPQSTEETKSESLRWFLREEEQAALPKDHCPEPMGINEFTSLPKPPEWFRRELEYQFRRGFCQGSRDTIENITVLTARGFQRPREICNILSRHLSKLHAWMRMVWADDIGDDKFARSTPEFDSQTWTTLREACFDRDNRKCMWCDSGKDLEAHHETPVSEGGLPELKNLRTLCAECHRGKFVPEPHDSLSEEHAQALLGVPAIAIGFPWSWADCDEASVGGRWQLMPARNHDDGDFWWWHISNRRQFFNDRTMAINWLMRSFTRWKEFQSRKKSEPK